MWLRPGSPRPRKRKISLSVSALRICSSMSGRIAGEAAAADAVELEISTDEDGAEFGSAATAVAPRAPAPFPSPPASARRIASTKSCTVSASATTRSGNRTPQASPRRNINSTRSRLPSPNSRSRCAFVPRATNSSIPRELPNSSKSWRTDAKACAATAGLRSSFVPVAPINSNGQFAAHVCARRRGNCFGERITARPPIQSPRSSSPRRQPRRRFAFAFVAPASRRLFAVDVTYEFVAAGAATRGRAAVAFGFLTMHEHRQLPAGAFALSRPKDLSRFLCVLRFSSVASVLNLLLSPPQTAKLPRSQVRVLSYWDEMGRAAY